MSTVIERTQGRYVPRHPRMCGADHGALIREELASGRSSEEVFHPLEEECRGRRKKQGGEFLRSESHYWPGWRSME